MTYAVRILRSAQKHLAGIDTRDRLRVIAAIRALAKEPHPPGVKKLSGRPAWRIRVGQYGVIYEIHGERLLILVVAVGHRRDVYR